MFPDFLCPSEAELGISGDTCERRREPREDRACSVFLIDNHAPAMITAICLDSSRGGMHLRVPRRCNPQVGQRFEVSAQLPGQSQPPGNDWLLSRRVVVVRSVDDADADECDVGVAVDLRRAAQHAAARWEW